MFPLPLAAPQRCTIAAAHALDGAGPTVKRDIGRLGIGDGGIGHGRRPIVGDDKGEGDRRGGTHGVKGRRHALEHLQVGRGLVEAKIDGQVVGVAIVCIDADRAAAHTRRQGKGLAADDAATGSLAVVIGVGIGGRIIGRRADVVGRRLNFHNVGVADQVGEGVVPVGIGRGRSDDGAGAGGQRHRDIGHACFMIIQPVLIAVQPDAVAHREEIKAKVHGQVIEGVAIRTSSSRRRRRSRPSARRRT